MTTDANIVSKHEPEILDPSSYPHIPSGEPKPEPVIEEIEEPTLTDLIPMPIYAVDKTAVSNLFDRHSRPAPVGETNRKTLTFTISLQTDEEWRDFLEIYTGTRPQRGIGISSPMVELSMLMLMGVVADFKLSEVAVALGEICSTPTSRQHLRDNLHSLADQI